MIFGFSQYKLAAAAGRTRDLRTNINVEGAQSVQTPAQVYDLAHQRRLRTLQSYIEEGYTLSEAARLLGVSTLTVLRWDDHGRR